MFDEGELWAAFTVWLGLVCVTGYYIVRIGLMLREQRIAEKIYRLRLAALRGKAVREMAERTES